MRSRTRADVLVAAVCTVLVVTSCSSDAEPPAPEADSPTSSNSDVELPGAPSTPLPSAWDGENGGMFTFTHGWSDSPGAASFKEGPLVSKNGLFALSQDGHPIQINWNGEKKALKSSLDTNLTGITHIMSATRDGEVFLSMAWSGRPGGQAGQSLQDSTQKTFVTTWNDRGETVVDEQVDYSGVDREGSVTRRPIWRSDNGTHLVDTGGQDTFPGENPKPHWTIDVFTGDVKTLPAPARRIDPSKPVDAPGRTTKHWRIDVDATTTESIINQDTEATVQLPKLPDCTPGKITTTSFSGRYVVFGAYVLDTKSNEAKCIAQTGRPEIQSFSDDGVGYGTGQTDQQVPIEYHFDTNDTTILDSKVSVPEKIGPNGEAVVNPGSDAALTKRQYAVYKPTN